MPYHFLEKLLLPSDFTEGVSLIGSFAIEIILSLADLRFVLIAHDSIVCVVDFWPLHSGQLFRLSMQQRMVHFWHVCLCYCSAEAFVAPQFPFFKPIGNQCPLSLARSILIKAVKLSWIVIHFRKLYKAVIFKCR